MLNGTAAMTRRGAGRIGYYLLTAPRRLADDPGTDEFTKDADREMLHLNGTDICTYHWPGGGAERAAPPRLGEQHRPLA